MFRLEVRTMMPVTRGADLLVATTSWIEVRRPHVAAVQNVEASRKGVKQMSRGGLWRLRWNFG